MRIKKYIILTVLLAIVSSSNSIANDKDDCIKDNITGLLHVGNYWVYETYYPRYILKTSIGSDAMPSVSTIDSFHIEKYNNTNNNNIYKAVRIIDVDAKEPYVVHVNLRIAGDSLLEEYYKGPKKVEVGIWALCPMEIGSKWTEFNYNESTFYEIIAQEDKRVHSGDIYKNCFKIKVKGINHNSGNIPDTWFIWFKPHVGLVCKEWKEGLGDNRLDAQQYLIRYNLE